MEWNCRKSLIVKDLRGPGNVALFALRKKSGKKLDFSPLCPYVVYMIQIKDIVLFGGFSCVVESLTDGIAVVRARGYSSRVWSVPVTDLVLNPLALAQGRNGDLGGGAFVATPELEMAQADLIADQGLSQG